MAQAPRSEQFAGARQPKRFQAHSPLSPAPGLDEQSRKSLLSFSCAMKYTTPSYKSMSNLAAVLRSHGGELET